MSESSANRKLTTILSADAAGYSRLTGDDEEATHATLNAYRELVQELIGAYGGRVFGGAGDSVMAEFPSPVEAVRSAIAIQEALAERNAELPPKRRMQFRIGINLGDVIVESHGLYGDSVNIAARLQALAAPGDICISEIVQQQVANKLDRPLRPLGRHEVKNIAEPVSVFSVLGTTSVGAGKVRLLALALVQVMAASGAIAWWWLQAAPRSPSPEPAADVTEAARPSRHFTVGNPAKLAAADALTIYDRIREAMEEMYGRSGNTYMGQYQTWRRYNLAPYRSATHGRRFVSNYANPTARAYGRFPSAGTLPVGSVLVKDSFEVTARGDVVTGPLSIMEKMAPGFNADSRDWRYTQIMPNGEIFGVTKGENADRVAFCIGCHRSAGDANDHLYFVPKKYRRQFFETPAPSTQ